jgi:hypothetical protein
MIQLYGFRRSGKLMLLLTILLLIPNAGNPHSANAYSTSDSNSAIISHSSTTKRGRSANRRGGASRGNCQSKAIPLTAVFPIINNDEKQVEVAQTVQERPILWVYVPYSSADGVLGEFVLQNADEKTSDRYEFTLPNQPGLMSFQLPQNADPLAVDQEYRWYFKLFCGNVQTSRPLFVSGWIRRVAVSPDLNRQIKTNPNQAYKAYAAQGIWYDALNDLIKRRQAAMADPSVSRDWQQLLSLENVRLETLSQEAIIGNVMLKIP